MNSFHNQFLEQIFASKEHVIHSQYEMLENIFNIYDYDGDGNLCQEEFLTFISDIVYISVLMKRFPEQEYNLINVNKIAMWSSSNFKTNLFRAPIPIIHHDLFIEGIIYALTENRQFPMFPNNNSICVGSFVPEIVHYFHYYLDVAKRRGWPTEIVKEEEKKEEEKKEEKEEEEKKEEEKEEEEMKEEKEEISTEPATATDQLVEYKERRRKKYQEEKERAEREKEEEHQRELMRKHEEQDRINRELHEQRMRLEAEQRERERRNLEEENRRRQLLILQAQMQQLQQLQANLRNHIRQSQLNRSVDQLDDAPPPPPLDELGEIEVSDQEEGYDPIEGNIAVLTFIKENPDDGIVFRCGDSYYLASKDRIRSMIQLGEKDNSLFYGCMCEIDGDWTQPQTWALLQPTVITNPIYYNIQQLGIPIRYVYLDEIKQVLDGTHHFFSIEKPEDYNIIPSFASDNVLNHGIGSMSGLHCQEGQMDVVYRIKRFTVKHNGNP